MDIHTVLSDGTIKTALQHIRKKKGAPGIDSMAAEELPGYWAAHGERIKQKILNGRYQPQPALVKMIPKAGTSKKRKIEIPCVLDRMLLYAIHMALAPHYEQIFSQHSYGFRKNLQCIDAIKACLQYMSQGCCFIVDLDIKEFFDYVNHELLFQRLQKDIHDPCLLSFIKKYVQTRLSKGMHIYKNRRGLPQGSAASPLFANIFLDDFDQYLGRRMVKFARYADDIVIFCTSRPEAEQALAMAENYLAEKLKLKLNMEKTQILKPEQLHYLGYSFQKRAPQSFSLTIGQKAIAKMFGNMQEHMDQECESMEEWWQRLGSFHRGWINYYKYTSNDILFPFLQAAEERQRWYFANKVCKSDAGLSRQYISALFQCPCYSSLTGWYQYKCMKDTEDKNEKKKYNAYPT